MKPPTPEQHPTFWDKHGGKTGEELEAVKESIHAAIELGNIEAVKQHLDDGADVNAKGRWGSTPLHAADNKEIAELLIAEGADVNAKTESGSTPLHRADNKEIAELLIAKGADVNAKSENGVTPLHRAALHGHKEIAKLFIAKGAHLNAKDDLGKLGKTPLDWAISRNHIEIADLLGKHGGKTGEELKAEGI